MTIGRKTYGIKVNHLPPNITKEQVQLYFETFGNILNVVLKTGRNECYAFVNFHSSSCAEAAAKKMDGAVVGGSRISCKVQREPMREHRPPSVGEYTVKVTCVSKNTSEDTLSGVFSLGNCNAIQSIRIMPCPNALSNYAYVNYFSQSDAERAVTSLDERQVDGSQIRVKLHAGQGSSLSPKLPEPPRMVTAPRSCSFIEPLEQTFGHLPIQRHLSQPAQMAAVPAHPSNTVETQSRTAKVSIFGELSSEDIKEVFSQFGQIKYEPIIRGGDPFYTFVNFTSPRAAADACSLHNSTVKGIKIYVRVHVSKQHGPDIESREVHCTSLAASILCTRHREELERWKKERRVHISSKPSSECIKVWGEKEAVTAVEVCIQDLVRQITTDISAQDCELPGHSVPLFKQESVLEDLKRVEENHGVEFCVLRAPPDPSPVNLKEFCKDVKECLAPPTSEAANTIAECSKFASYLKEKPQTPSTSWVWQNDSGSGFLPYEPDVCAKLNNVSANSESITLEIGLHEYSIDFSNMTQTNTVSGRSRPIKQVVSRRLRPKWFYKDDRKRYVPYTAEQSAEIEQMYQSNTPRMLEINHNTYTFDFTAMTQYNVITRNSRKIERRMELDHEDPPNPDVERVFTVRACGIPPSLDTALRELENVVTKATVEKECKLYAESSASFKVELVKNMNQYFVTAELMDECLKLKGVTDYVEKVCLQAEKAMISDREQCIRIGEVGVELPKFWEPQSEEICKNVVKRGSDEWNEEVTRIHKTLGNVTVVKLERIQNKWLWGRYSFAKKRMSIKNKVHVNEKHLFHGTRSTLPEKVYKSEKGVDFRHSKEGLWGMGSYFAVNASYSDRYAYTARGGATGEKQMFICKVLTGDSFNATGSDHTLRQPPLKPVSTHGSFEEERYDSVNGYTNGSYVYVVYDHEKVYPAYLVTYQDSTLPRFLF